MRDFKSGLINCIGTIVSIPVLVLLIIFSSMKLEAIHIVTFTVFGSCAMFQFLFNCLCNWITHNTAQKVFKKFANIFKIITIFSTYIIIIIMEIPSNLKWLLFSLGAGITILYIVFSSIWENIPNILLNILYNLTYILFSIFIFILIFA